VDRENKVVFYEFLKKGGIKFAANHPERNLRDTTNFAATQQISQLIIQR